MQAKVYIKMPDGSWSLKQAPADPKPALAGLATSTGNLYDALKARATAFGYTIDMTGVTNTAGAWQGAAAMVEAPYIDTTNVTNMSSMYSGCSKLTKAPTLNTSRVTIMSQMFMSCGSLPNLPPMDTSKVTAFTNAFHSTSSVTEMPAYDFSAATTIDNIFNGCGAATYPDLNFGSVTVLSASNYPPFGVANSKAVSVGVVTLSGLASIAYFFRGMAALVRIAGIVPAPGLTNTSYLFSGCGSLVEIPLFSTANVTSAANMFNGCTAASEIPAFDFSKVTSAAGIFPTNSPALKRVLATGMKVSFTIAGNGLEAAALNTLFSNLAPATGQTITITGNPGAATCDRSIATAKGWTVTG